MVIFQTQLLQEKLWLLRQNMSFLELALKIAPDVILNPKEQIDARGERRVFTQLEGAMGSVYLNLDRLAREKLGSPVVHFLQVPKEHRSQFFAPIKTAFDFFPLCRIVVLESGPVTSA